MYRRCVISPDRTSCTETSRLCCVGGWFIEDIGPQVLPPHATSVADADTVPPTAGYAMQNSFPSGSCITM